MTPNLHASAAAYFHDFNPYLIRFTDDWGIAWYGLSYILGFALAWLMLWRLARAGLILIPTHRVPDAMLLLVAGVMIGGRLGYALVYDPSLLWGFSSSAPWWKFLAINHGGMASHGGMAGAVLAAWIISRGFADNPAPGERAAPGAPAARPGACSPLHVADCVGLVGSVGLFFGRCANFINGELLGRIYSPPGQPGPWWTVQFPKELLGWRPTGTPGVLRLEEGVHHAPLDPAQQARLSDLVWAMPGESWNEKLRLLVANAGNHRSDLVPLLSSRHPSQLYQAVAEGIVLTAVIWCIWARPRRAGVITAWWLIVYGVLRIVTELWRLPDAQFGDAGRIVGLSRGQWLSAAMVGVGVLLLMWVLRRGAAGGPLIGGWLRGHRPPAPAR